VRDMHKVLGNEALQPGKFCRHLETALCNRACTTADFIFKVNYEN